MFYKTAIQASVFAVLLFTSCTKPKPPVQPPAEDKVVGNYFAGPQQPPGWVAGSASVTKISDRRYKFSPGTASVPSFEFVFDTGSMIARLFSNDFYYTIPRQKSGSYVIDSSSVALYVAGNGLIDFTVADTVSKLSWRYAGVKQ